MVPLLNKILINPEGGLTFRSAARSLAENLRRIGISKVLVGVSGGADSVLTLRLLAEVAHSYFPIKIGICHVNFHLRGKESMRDEEFVRLLAEDISGFTPDTQIFIHSFDTEDYAARNNLSIEMAARDLRHNLWNDIISTHDYQRIVTGHTADDNEETLLLNLLRGSSPAGLRGMSAIGDRILRPILYFNKPQILLLLGEGNEIQREYGGSHYDLLKKFPDGYITDSTNLEADFKRNYLRNIVIPLFEEKWEGASTAFQTTLTLQSEAADIVEYTLSKVISTLEDPDILPGECVREFPSPISLIYKWLEPYGIKTNIARDIARHVISDSLTFTEKGQRWLLENDVEVIYSTDTLKLRNPERMGHILHLVTSAPPETSWIKLENVDLSDILKSDSKVEIFLPEPHQNYIWRHPRQGDRIAIGKKGSKLVSDVLKEAKIPLSMRRDILILVNKRSDRIIWIPGVRRSTRDDLCINNSMLWHLKI